MAERPRTFRLKNTDGVKDAQGVTRGYFGPYDIDKNGEMVVEPEALETFLEAGSGFELVAESRAQPSTSDDEDLPDEEDRPTLQPPEVQAELNQTEPKRGGR